MIIDYRPVNLGSDYETVKATFDAIDKVTEYELNRYVSNATLDAMIQWVRSYFHFVRAACSSTSEVGWIHDTVDQDIDWARNMYNRLAAYRSLRR